MTAPYPPAAATPANEKTMLWGVLGIVFALCCPLLSIVFGILSMNEAKKVGKRPTLGYVGIGLGTVSLVFLGILSVTR